MERRNNTLRGTDYEEGRKDGWGDAADGFEPSKIASSDLYTEGYIDGYSGFKEFSIK